MSRFSLTARVLFALAAGTVLGLLVSRPDAMLPRRSVDVIKPVGTLFINAIPDAFRTTGNVTGQMAAATIANRTRH